MKTTSSAELRLTFSNPRLMVRDDNTERVAADTQMVFTLNGMAVAQSESFAFVAPIGLLEADDIKWYLESYYIWPVGLFKERAERIERYFPQWGDKLLTAITASPLAQPVFQQWLDASSNHEPVFSLYVQVSDTPESKTAASRLLGFPWELLRYHDQYLLTHNPPVRIRRNLPRLDTSSVTPCAQNQTVLRVLAVSPRPSQAGYIDHRASIKPLVEAVESLGKRVELVRVNPPTFEQLKTELRQAQATGKPFHVLHFDGHGVFDTKTGRGALCFEHPLDNKKLLPEFVKRIYADDLAALLTEYPLPLVFLEACQTGQSEAEKQEHTDPNASVAAALLQAGVASVIAMSHSVLVETARRFVSAFYQQLAEGQRIGSAVLAGRQTLMQSTDRINIAGAGTLQMQDWFVPVLYQREDDPRLFSHALQLLDETEPKLLLGDLPETPKHTFIGRSRELLKLERLLDRQPYAVIRGMGGIGKTAVAVELARWLVQCRRFERCAFVSVETYTHERAIVDILGKQLVNEKYSVAEYGDDLDAALQPIMQVLQAERTLLVIDNMESLLAGAGNTEPVLSLADTLLKSSPQTRLLFTTREPLSAPFNHKACDIELGALSVTDAKALVMRVMNNEGLHLHHDNQGNIPQEVDDLVNAVSCNARALVLLARELAQRGVKATTANVRAIMQELEQRHPGQRELSLFASVELSLRRLSPEVREQIVGLAVFQDGSRLENMAAVLEVDSDQMHRSREYLIQVGLAQPIGNYGYLRLDPALPTYLDLGLTVEQRVGYRQRWRDVMGTLVDFLYQQRFEDTKLAAQLTQLELPNLMAYLQTLVVDWQAGCIAAEMVVEKAGRVEQLLEYLHQSQARAQVVAWREQAAQVLDRWSHVRIKNKHMSIARLLQQGDLPAALQAAQALLQQCQQVGEHAYAGADYDLAMAHLVLGRVLSISGAATQALPTLQEAQRRFEALGEARMSAVRMTSAALKEQGDCLKDLGQLKAAAAAYENAIALNEKCGDLRSVAAVKGQLATIRLLQNRYADALQGHEQARVLFQQWDEPDAVATAWNNIGLTYRSAGDFAQAEQAYRQSLSISSQQSNRAGEACSLNELGNLYYEWNRSEKAVDFYWQAATIYGVSKDLRGEGFVRSNLAHNLIKLQRYDEARPELLRAIECIQAFGHAAEPWQTWDILHDLEQATGNSPAAREARQQSLTAYLAYRRDGGKNHSDTGRLALVVGQAIQQGDTVEVEQVITNALTNPKEDKNFMHKLQAIIAGERDLALAADERLYFELAAELILLLEQLREAGI
ncbi:CHAT domain-containing tetratricopeptide repeat protein [Candidatus Thiothrix anitrata]|uniref:CHAT domain-containing protein n=1 Tax=Candidatus Thiothrix anitrata TaxID=2823902 RepID=A0ABX7X1W9_9GAMM|nr:CHAT domain-containing protein [Candidatus Thiothrix anitrata]QTR49929.1 CHAT domain-containing protein [Candidatus Thiothrix anitrata]